MDRRAFLIGSLAGLGSCAAPERSLVSDEQVAAVRLDPIPTAPLAIETTETTGQESDPMGMAESLGLSGDDLIELSFVAHAVGEQITVHDAPRGAALTSLSNPIPSGGPLVFLVDEFAESWYRVLLPIRPNGSTGWVAASDVELVRHNHRIDVDLDGFELTAYDHGEVMLEASIGIARDNTPTPGGRYYVTELLAPPTPDSIYGVLAYGLSGYSEVLEVFAGGPGQLGIHGTNDPSTIGTKVSNGCIRLTNDDVTALFELGVPLGTPVTIH